MKNRNVLIVLALIILAAFAVRAYHFHDWLFFKWDQARDATLLSSAIENGPCQLPLLGPRATKVSGGDYLRLGPAYYYMQVISGWIFDSVKPDVFAYPDLFFSILTIPLFYFFLRLAFSRLHSLLGTTLYAFSFLIVQYSRFAWNPNSVPFFSLLSFYGLLKATNNEAKNRTWWVLLWIFSFAIASQLHFFAFFSLSGTSILYLILRYRLWKISKLWKKIKNAFSWQSAKVVLLSLLVFGVVYSPMVISEIAKGGNNSKNFVKALIDKPREDKTILEKIVRNAREQTRGFYMVLTSYKYKKKNQAGNSLATVVGAIIILSGLYLACKKYKNTDSNPMKKNFSLLVIFWILFFIIFCIPLAYQLRPRYFVPVFPVVFVIFCYWLVWLENKFGKKSIPIILAISFSLFMMNTTTTYGWFKEQALSQNKSFEPDLTYILKRDDGITLGQLEKAVDYMYKNSDAGKNIYFYSKAEYTSPIKYLLWMKNDPSMTYQDMNYKSNEPEATYFVVNSVRGGFDGARKAIRETFDPTRSIQFGQIAVFKLQRKEPQLIPNEYKLQEIDQTDQNDQVDQSTDEGVSSDEVPDENENANKSERFFWGDVFGSLCEGETYDR
jgi:hypothetical protein